MSYTPKYRVRPLIALEATSAPAPFKGAAFVSLRCEWYEKLRAEGFVDSELRSTSGYHSSLPRQWSRGMPNEEYYRVAAHHVHERVWPCRLSRRTWEMHAEGLEVGDILTALGCHARSEHTLRRMLSEEAERMRATYGHMREDGAHDRAVGVASGGVRRDDGKYQV